MAGHGLRWARHCTLGVSIPMVQCRFEAPVWSLSCRSKIPFSGIDYGHVAGAEHVHLAVDLRHLGPLVSTEWETAANR